ncbi:putative U-box domain-containing protein 50 [Cynara cardunculus var. scolymus]|uniref:putative U-box domain-containing protein 50 n=1 Tax=Cynara cardunculus var. scolymus TaxID=59895 RepID=UPI000D62ACE0|nr:putative U-box domain-containing protein 50 [Cynara cardunculus var. scolymus]
MERAAEKVYVAIGNDVQEGLATLEWTLRKWSSSQFSIVILHADINKDYVYTYYGKIPASYVNDQSVDFLKKCEQGKLNKILRQYIAFCGQVKTEILNIEKCDEPIHKRIVQLVSGLGICKLVMGITFLKSSSWKYGNLLSGLKHIQQKKPDFCELYLISGGKLFLLKDENNEGFIEDDQGAKLNKKRGSFRGWIGKMFPENVKSPRFSPSSTSVDSPSIWEKCAEEIEGYFNHLVEESESGQVSDEILESNRSTSIPRNLTPTQKTEFLRVKIGEARDAIHLKRREAKESVQRYSRAEWAINLCTSRSEDLEARLNEETMKRGALEKDLETIREELSETRIRLDQNRNKLDSTLEIQRELSRKLKSSTMVKSQSQEQLGKMINTRGGMIQDIEKLRKQKNVMQRRIEFCRDKDAIEMVTRLNNFGFSYKEFTAEEIRAGTDHFSEHCRIKCSGDFTNVYRARIDHTTVAVKLYDFRIRQVSEEEFDTKVKVLSRIQHPHVVAMIGFCKELKCIIFEYMHESCLRNVFFSNNRKNQALNWHARVGIAAEVCSGLSFLHLSKPRPMVHGNLNLGKILLDRNHVAKVNGFRLDFSFDESDIRSDIQDFGSLVLQLLTERNWCGFLDEVNMMNEATLVEVLDQRVGEWPLQVAMELARIAIRCSSSGDGAYTGMTMVMKEMEEVRKKADDVVAGVGCSVNEFNVDSDDETIIPASFFCPILKDVMKNPHIASDGFSYELSAIKQWLGMSHNTSPLTNLDLEHKRLTPNHTLRSLIHDWHKKRSIPLT